MRYEHNVSDKNEEDEIAKEHVYFLCEIEGRDWQVQRHYYEAKHHLVY
jgi:hypothetical protein